MRDVMATERLLLRELELDDVDALFEILGDAVAMRYYPAPFDRDRVAGWIEWARRSYVENGFGLWAVIRRSACIERTSTRATTATMTATATQIVQPARPPAPAPAPEMSSFSQSQIRSSRPFCSW